MKDSDIQFIPPPEAPAVFLGHFKEAVLATMGIPAHLLPVSERPGGNVRVEDTMNERRIVRGDSLDDTLVVWEKFECDCGCRWTQVKRSHTAMATKDGDPCNFSGCDKGHVVHLRGETSDRHEAHEWFNDAHAEKRV